VALAWTGTKGGSLAEHASVCVCVRDEKRKTPTHDSHTKTTQQKMCLAMKTHVIPSLHIWIHAHGAKERLYRASTPNKQGITHTNIKSPHKHRQILRFFIHSSSHTHNQHTQTHTTTHSNPQQPPWPSWEVAEVIITKTKRMPLWSSPLIVPRVAAAVASALWLLGEPPGLGVV
jgi:hypothetical protein